MKLVMRPKQIWHKLIYKKRSNMITKEPSTENAPAAPLVSVPVVTIFWAPKLGAIFVPAMAAVALMSASTIVPAAN